MKRGRPGYDQDAVLEVAVAAFNEHGFEATSMGVLADRLGISKSAIYHHVSSKEELLRMALERALGGLESVLDQAPADVPAIAALENVLRGTVNVLVEHLPEVTLLLRLRGNSEMEREALTRRRTIDRRFAVLVRQAQEEGALRSDIEARTAERLMLGTVNSLVEWYRPGGSLSASALADQVITMVFGGLRA
ncbi:TetR/AcrR family transcriptional regulator [Haematomicrobium sanguinis]|uniref:TetR/AcrR family transcriptional regulator n=1 Tax=Haematomicrobium sanguinis TaxID=479106 RepID=UPI00047E03CD|nr:TetR/AcrR family transcriptional regulator [Haematomicrobium sanguinis]